MATALIKLNFKQLENKLEKVLTGIAHQKY